MTSKELFNAGLRTIVIIFVVLGACSYQSGELEKLLTIILGFLLFLGLEYLESQ